MLWLHLIRAFGQGLRLTLIRTQVTRTSRLRAAAVLLSLATLVVITPGILAPDLSVDGWASHAGLVVDIDDEPVADIGEGAEAGSAELPADDIPESEDDVAPMTAAELAAAVVHVQTEQSAGSGFVAGDGLVLTSAHVVGDSSTVTVWFANGARRIGTVTAIDTHLDIAVVEVPRIPASVRALDWQSADSPAVATPVWAWGYPLERAVIDAGFTRAPTVTSGIVSASRIRDQIWFLQTDAALNAGNSGGPVVNVEGNVVAISTLILAPGGDDPEGLNFALDIAKHRADIRLLIARTAGESTATR